MNSLEKQEKDSYNEFQRMGNPGWSVNRTEDSVGSRNLNFRGCQGVVCRVTKTPPNHFNWVGGGCDYLYRSNGYGWVAYGYKPKKEAPNE